MSVSSNIVEFIDHPTIVYASALKLASGLRPYRVVLREEQSEFIVHDEYMRIRIEQDKKDGRQFTYNVLVCEHDGFGNGKYFNYDEPGKSFHGQTRNDALKLATECFESRREDRRIGDPKKAKR